MTDETIDPEAVADSWIDPRLPRCWAAMLIRTSGLHWRIIASLAGISPSAMAHLLWGRSGRPVTRIHIDVARALVYLSPEDVDRAGAARVPTRAARTHLVELHRIGWTDQQLQTWLRRSELALRTSGAFYCTVLEAARIAACYDYLVSHAAAQPLTA